MYGVPYALFDCHADTVTKAYKNGESVFSGNMQVTPDKLKMYTKAIQCYAIYNDGTLKMNDVYTIINRFIGECSNSKYVNYCRNSNEANYAHRQGRIAAFLTLESAGNAEDFSPDDVIALRQLGVRMISLTWNNDNSLCGGIEANKKGITEKGIKVLEAMEKCNMMLDVSHISDEGFFDALKVYKKPVCASHSNSRTVCNIRRNLTDEQIKAIIGTGGVIGINFFPDFVGERELLINHIEHIKELGGTKNIGIGSDFDGIDFCYKDLAHTGLIAHFFDEMFGKNYLKQFIYDVAYNNFNDIFKKFEIF